jgi:hypothetical protein
VNIAWKPATSVTMDVGSLLNSTAAAAASLSALDLDKEQSLEHTPTPSAVGGSSAPSSVVATPSPETTPSRRLSSGSRTPSRSRTPWDAGGYSLPLSLESKFIPCSPTKQVLPSRDSPTEILLPPSPKSLSPHHKFSDSHSSLSSYTSTCSSSNNSSAHSRFSSLSTVSETIPLGRLIKEHLDIHVPSGPEDRPRSPSDAILISRESNTG